MPTHPLSLIATCALVLAPAMPAAASPRTDRAEVTALMSEYHAAVIAHDGPRLARLFVPTGSAWFNVLSEPAYAVARAKTPDAIKARPGTVDAFVAFVTNSKAQLDPHHGSVEIRTDGTVASAYFDFRFLIEGKVQNTGAESWQLVRSADGWRIASIIYSSSPPSAK